MTAPPDLPRGGEGGGYLLNCKSQVTQLIQPHMLREHTFLDKLEGGRGM